MGLDDVKKFTDNKTSELLEEERKAREEHQRKLGWITMEIEKMLIDADFTMGDFLEIVDMFTRRANAVFSETKIKKIKDTYGKV